MQRRNLPQFDHSMTLARRDGHARKTRCECSQVAVRRALSVGRLLSSRDGGRLRHTLQMLSTDTLDVSLVLRVDRCIKLTVCKGKRRCSRRRSRSHRSSRRRRRSRLIYSRFKDGSPKPGQRRGRTPNAPRQRIEAPLLLVPRLHNLFACNDLGWWTARGSNSRPPHCERGALPTELAAHWSSCVARHGKMPHVHPITLALGTCRPQFDKAPSGILEFHVSNQRSITLASVLART